MLPAPCRWIHCDDGSFLQWHYGCVGSVKQRDGRWLVSLSGWGITQEHSCASREQGVRFLERWVSARGGLPGFRSKAEARVSRAKLAAREPLDPTAWPFGPG